MAHWYTCEECEWHGSTSLHEGGMVCPECGGHLIYDGGEDDDEDE